MVTERTPLGRLAETSATIAATSSRKAKSEALAAVIADLHTDEIEPAVGFLTGSARQGRVGVGWASVRRAMDEAGPPPSSETERPGLTITDFDELISEIADTTGSGSERARTDRLVAFIDRATEVERGFVASVLIGDLRQGALAGVVTDAVAKAAGVKIAVLRRAVMLSGDLGHAATIAMTGGADALADIDLEAGRPILPMLAATAPDVGEALQATGAASVEWKLDGARIQVHRTADGGVRIVTRNLNDVTDRLPGVVDAVLAMDCSSVVLDGEVLGMTESPDDTPGDSAATADASTENTPRAFQDTMSHFGSRSESDGDQPERPGFVMRPFFFDVMFLDGESLVDTPLSERRATLERLTGELAVPAVAVPDDEADPDTPRAHAQAHLDAALAAGHEGVMVKALDSPYQAGRRGKTWRKVKPVHTLDLVVLAAEWGHGRRQGWLSNLHLGARDPATGEFVMVGKTFKGLTDDLLAWQTEAFTEREVRRSASGHTVYIRNELVVEIALDGAQASTRYPGGVALRFARVRGYRPDRDPASADTLDAVRALLPRGIADR